MMNRFAKELNDIIKKDEKSVLILMGIGRYIFKECMEYAPERAFDVGVMEQAAVGMAAGMAAKGMTPFLYTWAPFLIERAYEQLKLDFGSQSLSGNFIGAGASYDLAGFGDSHYCPADVPILMQIRNMQIVVPGTADEFAALFQEAYNNHSPTYYRLSNYVNDKSYAVHFGRANVLRKGSRATLIVVGPMLNYVLPAADRYDVTVIYYTTAAPFDSETLKKNMSGDRIMIFEPYSKGAILKNVIESLPGCRLKIELVGYDSESPCRLGEYSDHIVDWGWDEDTIRMKLEKLLDE